MEIDVRQVVNNCLICRRRRTVEYVTPLTGEQSSIGMCFNDHLGLDYAGPLFYEGNRYCLFGIIDYFTRWCEVATLWCAAGSSPTMEETVRLFEAYWTSRYGLPLSVRFDNESHLSNEEFQVSLRRAGVAGVARVLIPPYHPESNSIVEALFKPSSIALVAVWQRGLR